MELTILGTTARHHIPSRHLKEYYHAHSPEVVILV